MLNSLLKGFGIGACLILLFTALLALTEHLAPMPKAEGRELMIWHCNENGIDPDTVKLEKTWYGWDYTERNDS